MEAGNEYSPEKHNMKETTPMTAPATARDPNRIAEEEMMAAVMRKRTTNEHTPQTVRRKANATEMTTVTEVSRMTESRPRATLAPMAAI